MKIPLDEWKYYERRTSPQASAASPDKNQTNSESTKCTLPLCVTEVSSENSYKLKEKPNPFKYLQIIWIR